MLLISELNQHVGRNLLPVNKHDNGDQWFATLVPKSVYELRNRTMCVCLDLGGDNIVPLKLHHEVSK